MPVAQAPDLALIEAKQAVPSVLREGFDEVLARSGVVELYLVIEQHLADRTDRSEIALPAVIIGAPRHRHFRRIGAKVGHPALGCRVGCKQVIAPIAALAPVARARFLL